MGCPKNEADSRSVARALLQAGISLVDEPEEAAYTVINTCGFIQDAKEESIAAILESCAADGGGRVLVTGCLVERYRKELQAGIPEVGGWFGLAETERLVAFLREALAPSRKGSEGRVGAGSYAYVKISDGCDESCTFCAIPGIKGAYYSVDPQSIMAEVEACLDEGAKELVLVGQDTAVWRHGSMELTDLIDLMAADERVVRIRLMYLQPEHVTDDLIRYMAGQPKLCRYLDIPFQHADAGVLRRMGRRGDGRDYLALLARARRLMPDVSVRSTFIVGFPGETDGQFESLMDFVEAAGFDHAGGFVYSPEEGTAAFRLEPRVGETVARERLGRLSGALISAAEDRHLGLVGSLVEVLVDSRDPEDLEEGMAAVGRTCAQAPEVDGVTYIEGHLSEEHGRGDVVTVRVTEVLGYDLIGEVTPSA